MNHQVLFLGAESTIFQIEQWGRDFVVKWRQPKPYLLGEIDRLLRITRTSKECKMLNFVRIAGVPTPSVYSVDLSRHTIMMDFIPGKQLKQLVTEVSREELQRLSKSFGRLIALLHNKNVVHGDPTTSNVIVDPTSKLWMVDFGLAEWNATEEMKGVDLHLIRRAFETTHWDIQDIMLESTIEGYTNSLVESADRIIARMEEIRERGRYH